MSLNSVLDTQRQEGDVSVFDVDARWAQGRTLFGGLQAALCLRIAQRLLGGEAPPLRALQLSFVAPVAPGTVRGQARLLRRGRSAVQVEASLLGEDGQTACTAVVIFGHARESAVQRSEPPVRPSTPLPKPIRVPHLPGVTPAFLQNFVVEWHSTGAPFTAQAEASTDIHAAPRDASLDVAHLVALADVVPTPALSWFNRPLAASSMTWMLQIMDDDCAFAPERLWRLQTTLHAASDGYAAQTTVLSNPDGRLAAIGHQTVVVFG